jgi:hypothetical protein
MKGKPPTYEELVDLTRRQARQLDELRAKEDFGETLVSDCFLAYDPLPFAKQKCLAHLLKTCGEIERSKSRGAVRFSRRVAALLRRVMALKRRRGRDIIQTLKELIRRGPGHVVDFTLFSSSR